jgi:hypothetical protein
MAIKVEMLLLASLIIAMVELAPRLEGLTLMPFLQIAALHR